MQKGTRVQTLKKDQKLHKELREPLKFGPKILALAEPKKTNKQRKKHQLIYIRA